MTDRFLAATILMCVLIGLSFELYPHKRRSPWESLIAFGAAVLVSALGWGAWWLIGG